MLSVTQAQKKTIQIKNYVSLFFPRWPLLYAESWAFFRNYANLSYYYTEITKLPVTPGIL